MKTYFKSIGFVSIGVLLRITIRLLDIKTLENKRLNLISIYFWIIFSHLNLEKL
jgi:hypothetical protein